MNEAIMFLAGAAFTLYAVCTGIVFMILYLKYFKKVDL